MNALFVDLALVTLSWWTSLDAIRAFAGDPVDQARYYPADAEYLLTRPATVLHYESSELIRRLLRRDRRKFRDHADVRFRDIAFLVRERLKVAGSCG
jgi:hypothetical protein